MKEKGLIKEFSRLPKGSIEMEPVEIPLRPIPEILEEKQYNNKGVKEKGTFIAPQIEKFKKNTKSIN